MDRVTGDSSDDPASPLDALLAAAHEAARERLVVSTSGNLSQRLGAGRVAISAARSRLGSLAAGEIVTVDLAGRQTQGAAGQRPSRETPMHLAVYAARPDVGAVLHCQSLAATVLACSAAEAPRREALAFIPEVPVYLKRIERVTFLPPGSPALAEAVAEAARDPEVRVVQLAGHGQVVVGDDPAQAVERATFHELACRIYLQALGRVPLRSYGPEELRVLAGY